MKSVAFILSACDDIITCTGFVAGMVAKYALLCTFVGGGRSYWLLGKVRVPSNQKALGRVFK